MNYLYAIYDILAQAIAQQIYIAKHDAVAIRWFQDVATTEGSYVRLHTKDFELIRLGTIDDFGSINGEREVVITGKAWLATQERDTTGGRADADVPLSLGITAAE